MSKILLALAFILPCCIYASQPTSTAANSAITANTGTIKVLVKNLHSDMGKVNVIMYKDAYTFPDKPDRSYKTIWSYIKGGNTEAVFENIPYGEYAFAAYHDENDNHRLDLSVIGIPKEGLAISNEAKGFILPKFKDAKVALTNDSKTIVMTIKY